MIKHGGDEAGARAANARLARDYDAIPYVPQPEPMLDLERVLGLAALYGCGGPAQDATVLDLGCGAGVSLQRLGGQTSGALVGTDISAVACAAARERLGERATIQQADLLDLDPQALGQFDVAYCIGVICVTPPAVTQRVFELLGQVLKPGGVAVLSYYCGSLGAAKANLSHLVRSAVDAGLPPAAQVEQARLFLRSLAEQMPPSSTDLHVQVVRLALSHTNDSTLFHENLGGVLTATHTSDLATALEAQGLRFLSYLHPMNAAGLATAAERAKGADGFDYLYGGYRYAAFAKMDGPGPAPDAARVPRWRSGLARRSYGPAYKEPAEFQDPQLGTLRIADPLTQALLDVLVRGPASRDDILRAAALRLEAAGIAMPADAAALLDADLLGLWQGGWLTPLGHRA